MILYGSTMSPFVRKVAAYAAEKGIELELQPTGIPAPTPEFCAASPFKKMPALSDGDYCLSDSSAIIHYLEAKYPEPELIPAEPRARGRVIWFDEFADTILFGCGQKVFFNRVVAPRFLGRPGDEAVAEAALRDEWPPILDYVETVMPEGEGYLVGDRLTLADISVASPFANFRHLGIEIDPARHPKAAAYVKRMLDRPSFKHWVDREAAYLAKVPA
ncbi:MAG TPA: glutathione S-transferase family protein [Sphingomicrobium sp.]|nr:glutathione S-transferase family protein [Sphingomicrobium sp.]